ncbi:hypothetical protein TrLO_g10662 [Triparma laevis f. longispina]|uniref:Nuclear condensin complex subunit 3 C-terminal domain-containing protein n=1 Tax=Triparma laevis f. longispina TaxID=1714387 RepID=A0A9W7AFQ6_9STRA|nr:hypothetical protein TrLO_g10662 [Triparma laevis f. longispina]
MDQLLTSYEERSPSSVPAPNRAVSIAKSLVTYGKKSCPPSLVSELISSTVDLALLAPRSETVPANSALSLTLELCSQTTFDTAGLVPGLDFLLYRGLLRLPSSDDTIRARATTLCGDVVSRMGDVQEDGIIEEETFDLVYEALFPRLDDKNVAVRSAAVSACSMLQDSGDAEDELTKKLMYMCSHDTSPVVRAAATKACVVTKYTLPTIICRVRDVSNSVRVAALDVLKNQVDCRLMTDLERVVVLRSGLTPRCEVTYLAASRMLCCGWLKSLGYSLLNLLKLLDVANNEAECALVIKAIIAAPTNATLKELSSNEVKAYNAALNNPIEVNNLTIESALLLRVKVDNLKDSAVHENKKQELVEELMPDTPVICSMITKHLGRYVEAALKQDEDADEDADEDEEEDLDDSFVCLQLLKLARNADFADESGRKQMLSLLNRMLCSGQSPDELVEPSIRALAVAHQTEAEYIQRIQDIIAEVSDYDAESEDGDANDAAFRQLRIVSVVGVVLEHTKRNLEDPQIASLSDTILPAFASADAVVREAAVICLGKYTLLGLNAAMEFRPLLLGMVNNVEEETSIRAQALLAMSDLAMLWPVMLEETDAMDMSTCQMNKVSLPELLTSFLDNAQGPMVVIAAEICCKLMMMGRIQDNTTLAKLVVTYFDPLFSSRIEAAKASKEGEEGEEGEEEENLAKDVAAASQKQLEADTDDATAVGSPIRLQQMLSLFFNAFVTLRGGEHMGNATMEVLRLVSEQWKAGGAGAEASRKSRKRNKGGDGVALDKVVSFVANSSGCYGDVALETCQYIIDESAKPGGLAGDVVKDLAKSLSGMTVEKDFIDLPLLRECGGDVENILEETGAGNKTLAKSFQKFLVCCDDALEEVVKLEKLGGGGVGNENVVVEEVAEVKEKGKAKGKAVGRKTKVLGEVQA